jgi:hypothetical protein
MYFCVQAVAGERGPEKIRALHLSLNTPVIAIDELPVGPARAGLAVSEADAGGFQLQIAVRSIRTGHVVWYASDEELPGQQDVDVAVDAALSFAEGMGFLFDEDEVAARGDGGSDAAVALWRELVEDDPEPACEPEPARAAPRRSEPPAPVLDLVHEVPVRDLAPEPEPVAVVAGEDIVLSDVAGSPLAHAEATAAPEAVLSKFRLVMRAGGIGTGAVHQPEDAAAVVATAAVQDSRIRLLSRF